MPPNQCPLTNAPYQCPLPMPVNPCSFMCIRAAVIPHVATSFSSPLCIAATFTFCSAVIPKLADLHNRFLDAYQVHLTISPTTRLAAGPIDQVQPWVEFNGKLVDVFDAYAYTVFLGPPLGLPAISIPIGMDTEGMPLGLQLQARPGRPQLSLTAHYCSSALYICPTKSKICQYSH